MTALSLLLPGVTRRSRHVTAKNMAWFRAKYMVVLSGLVEPILYLFSIGVGVGALVGTVEFGGSEIPYDQFVAPALLATSAFTGALFESTMNIYAKLKWSKAYDAMIATPLTPGDIALGELAFSQLRAAFYGTVFLGTMIVFGLVQSWWAVLAVPAAALLGSATAACGLAGASYMRSWQDFDIVVMIQVPLFLFSATFYPLSTYPEVLQWIVRATPLYHGVDLIRALVLGSVGWGDLAHVAYLTVMLFIGLAVASRRFKVLLHD